jgi:hypothetical protein
LISVKIRDLTVNDWIAYRRWLIQFEGQLSRKETLKRRCRASQFGRGRVKRALFLFNMAFSQKGVVFFVSLNEIAVGASKCSTLFPLNQFIASA